jgi:hypothetical protein
LLFKTANDLHIILYLLLINQSRNMKKTLKKTGLGALCLLLFGACKPNEKKTTENSDTEYDFSITVEKTTKANAPALQSFAHWTDGNNWFLFAGRTNQKDDNGGIHMINGDTSDYSVQSFPPPSFNTEMILYNYAQDAILFRLSIDDFLVKLEGVIKQEENREELEAILPNIRTAVTSLRSTNPLVAQDGDYLYLVGGYGTDLDSASEYNPNNYQTFNTVIRLHIPSIRAVVMDDAQIDWSNFFRYGTNNSLRSTGGELHIINGNLYLCGGHNYGKYAKNGQEYVNAVFPFTVSNSPGTLIGLDIQVGSPISDMPNQLGTHAADSLSTFRRRDGPIVPILIQDTTTSPVSYVEGVAFYGGVFKFNARAAWNDAIYITPDLNSGTTNALSKYVPDTEYDQNNYNVYSCPDFGVVSPGKDGVLRVHTFLPGGIGDGSDDGNLSGFTDSHVQAILNTKTLKSTPLTTNSGTFGQTNYFYGAEASFMPVKGDSVKYFNASTGETDFIDAEETFKGGVTQVTVGYIYGGIVAFQKSPGKAKNKGFGPDYSAASNTIWKVTLHATPKS